jgi:hypothetical protein
MRYTKSVLFGEIYKNLSKLSVHRVVVEHVDEFEGVIEVFWYRGAFPYAQQVLWNVFTMTEEEHYDSIRQYFLFLLAFRYCKPQFSPPFHLSDPNKYGAWKRNHPLQEQLGEMIDEACKELGFVGIDWVIDGMSKLEPGQFLDGRYYGEKLQIPIEVATRDDLHLGPPRLYKRK